MMFVASTELSTSISLKINTIHNFSCQNYALCWLSKVRKQSVEEYLKRIKLVCRQEHSRWCPGKACRKPSPSIRRCWTGRGRPHKTSGGGCSIAPESLIPWESWSDSRLSSSGLGSKRWTPCRRCLTSGGRRRADSRCWGTCRTRSSHLMGCWHLTQKC